jgi:hypothetical protein
MGTHKGRSSGTSASRLLGNAKLCRKEVRVNGEDMSRRTPALRRAAEIIRLDAPCYEANPDAIKCTFEICLTPASPSHLRMRGDRSLLRYCFADGETQVQTGSPKEITLAPLARNNLLVELTEQSGGTQVAYLGGGSKRST